jgi:hypothetical protein
MGVYLTHIPSPVADPQASETRRTGLSLLSYKRKHRTRGPCILTSDLERIPLRGTTRGLRIAIRAGRAFPELYLDPFLAYVLLLRGMSNFVGVALVC